MGFFTQHFGTHKSWITKLLKSAYFQSTLVASEQTDIALIGGNHNNSMLLEHLQLFVSIIRIINKT